MKAKTNKLCGVQATFSPYTNVLRKQIAQSYFGQFTTGSFMRSRKIELYFSTQFIVLLTPSFIFFRLFSRKYYTTSVLIYTLYIHT